MGSKATPRAYQIAKAHGISISEIVGTGKNGYVLPVDVEGFLAKAPVSAKANGGAPPVGPKARLATLAMASQGVVDALANGAVLPVSILPKLRFRQDNGFGELVGEDVLGLRPAPVGGIFRSDPSMIQWYVQDRGHFYAPPAPMEQDRPIEQKQPDGTKSEQPREGFAVTE